MARTTRRVLLPSALVLLIMLVSAGRLTVPVDVKAAFDPNGPAWDPLSTFDVGPTPQAVLQPPRLLAGTNSHDLPANAIRRNGYCLDVNVNNITPYAGGTSSGPGGAIPDADLGFFVYATDPVNPAAPASVRVPIPATGLYVDGAYVPAPGDPANPGVASANTATPSTADDIYCVVVHAPEGYRQLHIEWHYRVSGGDEQVLPLVAPPAAIPIVNVTLEKIGDGVLGGPAEVCTIGWDSAFLTGETSNAGGLGGVNPDPLDQVSVNDWDTQGGSANVFIDYVRKVGPEWCAGVGSTTVESNVQVIFNFHAVYNRVDIGSAPNTRDHDGDDQPAAALLPVAATEPADRRVDIEDVPELRHVTIDGYIPPRAESGAIVINTTHIVCIAGSGPGDTLLANDIQFSTLSGSPGAIQLQIFTKGPADTDLPGVPNGTLCFSYTSGTPGRHAIQATFSDNGTPTTVFFDTDQDGNGTLGAPPAGPLVTEWVGIGSTVITAGGSPFGTGNNITNTRQSINLSFNIGSGTYIAGGAINEWVLSAPAGGGQPQLVSGAWLRVNIVTACGYFVVPNDARPVAMSGVSVNGEFELNAGDSDPMSPAFGDTDAQADRIVFSITNDPDCTPSSIVRIEINVYYPGQLTTPAAPLEYVEFGFTRFQPALKTPRLAWAGQIVTITYAISSSGSCEDEEIHFVRHTGQPGAFLADPGVLVNGADHAIVGFGVNCSATVRYESEDPGEVDIEAFIEGNDFSKVAFPIYYMVFEDIQIEATPDQFVSTFGDVTAHVRGWFPGTNPSGRAAETKPDGRTVPADRWVLPTDWEQLKGPSEFRGNWGSPEFPEDARGAVVTFFMENENIVNNYRTGVKNGASGFFIPDDEDDFFYPFNINPHTKIPSVLGTTDRPRIMSQPTTSSGEASVDTFGDRNLTYEGCPPNAITGNPHCRPEDIAGRTRYYAVVEYPQAGHRGKWPAIASNVSETVWRWAGYKDVTIVNTDSPQIKYVVAHLRDRDGFCDAANFNNVLGVPVRFEIDAGEGTIIDVADRPSSINGGRRFATGTTFDTTDALGRPINVELVKPPLFADSPDECQAWIKITNSLMLPTNVMVTFPPPPSPVPGDIRITGIQCDGVETITVQNFGTNVVNLGGFGLESVGDDVGNSEQYDLRGVLEPGQSATFYGGPGADSVIGWIGTGSEVLEGPGDFAALVWEDFVLSVATCGGQIVHNKPPASFPLDGEGEIVIDITIPFGAEIEQPIVFGWNLVPTGQGTVDISEAFAGFEDQVTVIYVWDSVLEEWSRYIPDAPDGVNTIDTIGNGQFMWVLAKGPFTLTLPK